MDDSENGKAKLERLQKIVLALRDPVTGCSWDNKQSFETIVPYTIEEAYEIEDAVQREDFEELKSELGDLLFQIVFLAQIACERQLFSLGDVIDSVCDKMRNRHPHVFSSNNKSSESRKCESKPDWEQLKKAERNKKDPDSGILDGIAITLPPLRKAEKLQKRAAEVGFDWPDIRSTFNKLDEEIGELVSETSRIKISKVKISGEIGDCLFSLVNIARKYGISAEDSLKKTNKKFISRFEFIENALQSMDSSFDESTLKQLETYWQKAKQFEKSSKTAYNSSDH